MPQELALTTKISLLRYLKTHSERNTAKKFEVSKTTVHNIKMRKAEYISRYRTGNRLYRRKCIQTKNSKINLAVLRWYRRIIKKNITVTGVMLQRQALKYGKKLKITNFMASNGWLQSFKKRYLIKNKESLKEKAKESDPKVAAVVNVPEAVYERKAEDVNGNVDDKHTVEIETDTVQDNNNINVPDYQLNNNTTASRATTPDIQYNNRFIDYVVSHSDDFLLRVYGNEQGEMTDFKYNIKTEPQDYEQIDTNLEDVIMPDMSDFKTESADDENNDESLLSLM